MAGGSALGLMVFGIVLHVLDQLGRGELRARLAATVDGYGGGGLVLGWCVTEYHLAVVVLPAIDLGLGEAGAEAEAETDH